LVAYNPLYVPPNYRGNVHFRLACKEDLAMMIKDHKFWVGVVVGVIAYYVYANHVRKGMNGA
jgi:hypothetical protein